MRFRTAPLGYRIIKSPPRGALETLGEWFPKALETVAKPARGTCVTNKMVPASPRKGSSAGNVPAPEPPLPGELDPEPDAVEPELDDPELTLEPVLEDPELGEPEPEDVPE